MCELPALGLNEYQFNFAEKSFITISELPNDPLC